MTLRLTDRSHQIWGENLPYWFIAMARVASLFLMAGGLVYWVDMLGIFGQSGLERGPWQEVAIRVILACSFLIAALGVWLLSFWGVVMWVLSSLAQIAAISTIEDFIAYSLVVLTLHLIALVGLVVCFGVIYAKSRKNAD